MRKTVVCLLVLVSAAPMYARRLRRLTPDPAPVTIEVTEVSHDPAVARNLIAQVQHSRIERDHERVLAIINNSSARAVLIPAAGSVRGGGNTFFRSDVTMVNYNDTDQNVAVIWMPQGGTASTYKTTFPGGRPPFTQQDFIGTLLKTSGLGALLFIPITSTGAVDTDGAIDVFSRIWTPQPNSTGTVSQPFPGVDPDHIDDFEAIMLGLRQDASYRTNVGIVNMSPDKTFHFTITIFPEVAAPGTQLTEMHVTLLPLSMVQQAVPGSYTTPINILVEVDDDVDIKDLHWSAYASSTDNITGDGWVSIAAHDWDDDTLDSAAVRTRRGR